MLSEKQRRWVAILLISLLILLNLFLLGKIWPLLEPVWDVFTLLAVPVIVSLIIAYLLHPIVDRLNAWGVPRSLSVLLIYFSFVGAVGFGVFKSAPVFVSQLQQFGNHLPELTATYEKWVREYQEHKYELPHGVQIGVEEGFNQAENALRDRIAGLINGATGKLERFLFLLVIPFIVFYFVKDMKWIQQSFLMFVPKRRRREITRLFGEIDEALGNYIRGQLIVCLIVGVLAYIGFWLIGLPYPFVLALIIGLTNIIPYFGPLIGAAPAILIALTISVKMLLLVLAVNLAVQVLEGNLVSPLVVGKTLKIHPLMIIFALLVGGEVGGIAGLILAVPVAAMIKVIAEHTAVYFVRR